MDISLSSLTPSRPPPPVPGVPRAIALPIAPSREEPPYFFLCLCVPGLFTCPGLTLIKYLHFNSLPCTLNRARPPFTITSSFNCKLPLSDETGRLLARASPRRFCPYGHLKPPR